MDATRLTELFKEHAVRYDIVLNPDGTKVSRIVERLLVSDEKYGHRLCPCRPPSDDVEKNRLIICPCIYHLDEVRLLGKCLCQLFLKKP